MGNFKNKECINNKNDLEGKLVFFFSHREPFENNLKFKKNLSNINTFKKIRLYKRKH